MYLNIKGKRRHRPLLGSYHVQGSVVVAVVGGGSKSQDCTMLCLRASRDQKSSKNDPINLKFEIHKCLFPNESK